MTAGETWGCYGDPSLPTDAIVDFSDLRRNMYGCSPCRCGSQTRVAYRFVGPVREPVGRTLSSKVLRIECDDCGVKVVATEVRP